MKEIKLESFSDNDLEILKSLDIKEVRKYIDLFRDYKVILWIHGDTGKKYPLNELPPSYMECIPEYPEWYKEFSSYFLNIDPRNEVNLVGEEFFVDTKYDTLSMGTLYSPSLICALIKDACLTHHFYDCCIENGCFLKAMLHLEDCLLQYYAENDIIYEEAKPENKEDDSDDINDKYFLRKFS